MQKVRLLPLALFAASVLGVSGCGLISADFDVSAKFLVGIQDPDNSYEGLQRVDLNDYEEYRDNKSRLRQGEIRTIEIEVVDKRGNTPSIGVGQVDIKRGDDPSAEWIEAVGAWEGVAVQIGNKIVIEPSVATQRRVKEVIFGGNDASQAAEVIELRIIGLTDTGPVDFEVEVTLNMVVTAGG